MLRKKIKIWISVILAVATGLILARQELQQTFEIVKKHYCLGIVRRSLDVDKLRAKALEKDPLWMQEQLEEDFGIFKNRVITTKEVDRTFATIVQKWGNTPRLDWWVRYRVINRKLYRFFPTGNPISLIDNYIERSIKVLLELYPIKDLDVIIGFEDGMPLDEMPRHFWMTPDSNDQAPVLISAKRKNTPYVVLIPDWRSVSWHWDGNIKSILSSANQTPWNQKVNRAIWRGDLTRHIRLKLCEIGKQFPHLIDAKINKKANDPIIQQKIEKEELSGGWIGWDTFLKHKFLPILDGVMCAAPALQWRLLSRSLTLKQESDEVQWFYKGIQPYEHYVPIRNDLSDVVEQIQWATTHDAECEQISNRAYEFAIHNLLMEDVYHYFYSVLQRYGELQKVDRGEMLSEMKSDPRWVLIENRSTRQQKLTPEQTTVNAMTPY
jgi:hypothetical protein